jgi:tetratricopeptide (TPR) repeat protein
MNPDGRYSAAAVVHDVGLYTRRPPMSEYDSGGPRSGVSPYTPNSSQLFSEASRPAYMSSPRILRIRTAAHHLSHARSGGLLVSMPLAMSLAFLAASVWADRIEYVDGRVMEGSIVSVDEQFVVIRDGTADFKIPRSVVKRIIEGTPADRWLREAKSRLAGGDREGAIEDLGRAVREGVSPDSLAAVMVRFEPEIAQIIPTLRIDRRHDLFEILKALENARLPRQGSVLLARIHFHLQAGDVAGVDPLIAELQQSYPEAFDPARDQLIEWFERNIDEYLASRRYDYALDYLVQLRRLDPDRAGDKRVLLVLQWARRERDMGNYEKAIDIYVDQLLPASPEIARNRIADVLERAEIAGRNNGETGRSITLYERYGLQYAPDISRERLVRLWNELGFAHLRADRLDEARRAFARVDELNPGAASDGYLLCEHAERKSVLRGDDVLGHYELGEWALANGLLIEARRAFLVSADAGPLRAASQAQLRFIDNMMNESELSRLIAMYEKGDYANVLNGVYEFKGRPLSRGFRSQAEQLEQLAQDALRLTVAERSQQAEVLWQQAERAYYSRDYAAAHSLLRALIERYGDTPAGVRGEEFYRRIRPTLALNQIESPRSRSARYSDEDDEGSSGIAEEIRRLRRATEPVGGGSPSS